MKIPITKPYFTETEEHAIIEPLKTGWVVQGPKVSEFEKKVSKHSGISNAVATTSCTTGLHLALLCAGIGPGDEVIVPSFTYIATANAVAYVGATPVFADISLDTYNLDPASFESLIGPCTKAVVPVHLFGLIADMDQIIPIAKEHDLKIVEDAACAIGARYNGLHAGSFGHSASFSFHPRKIICTGEGGMLLTKNDDVGANARILRDHGATISDSQRHEKRGFLLPDFRQLGYNYRMTDFQGAVGVEQMDKLDWILEKRRYWASRYNEALKEIDWLSTPTVPAGYEHTYQSYTCMYTGAASPDISNVEKLHQDRNSIMAELEDKGVATRQGTHAVHLLDYYKKRFNIKKTDCPKSYLADQLSISLPLYPQMTEEEWNYVVDALKNVKG